MNKLTIIGNLTRKPETRTTAAGKSVCTFTVAVNRRSTKGNQSEADFFRVSAWGAMGESCQKYLDKGRKVAVVGSVSVNAYQAQNGEARASLEVMATDVEFLSERGEGAAQTEAEPETKSAANNGYVEVPDDEDLPF